MSLLAFCLNNLTFLVKRSTLLLPNSHLIIFSSNFPIESSGIQKLKAWCFELCENYFFTLTIERRRSLETSIMLCTLQLNLMVLVLHSKNHKYENFINTELDVLLGQENNNSCIIMYIDNIINMYYLFVVILNVLIHSKCTRLLFSLLKMWYKFWKMETYRY